MTNKEYKAAREAAEQVDELFEFEKQIPGHWFTTKMLDNQDMKELRKDYKNIKGAFSLPGFNGRAVIIPIKDGAVLKSYNTIVAAVRATQDGVEFIRSWDGFSVTTLKHINIFRTWHGFDTISKREWIELPTRRVVLY